MSLQNKVIWSEGMYLNPQHFQQQERYLEAMLDGRISDLIAYGWGIRDFQIDQQLLGLGKISIIQAEGIMPDGTPFSFPGKDDAPPVIEVAENTQNSVVYLCLPVQRQGAVDVNHDDQSQSLARYIAHDQDIRDVSDESGESTSIEVGKLNLRLLLASDDRSGYLSIGLIRIAEVGDDKRIALDDDYIATNLDCNRAPKLQAYITEVAGLLHSRSEAIASRLADPGRAGSAEIADYLLLQLINRTLPLVKHYTRLDNLHPMTLYAQLIQLLGELSTFVATDKKAPEFLPYLHEDLQACFSPLLVLMRKSFSTVHEQTAVALTLVEKKYGIRVAEINDRSLIGSASFVMAVRADVTEEQLRNRFPAQVKIGPVERIRQLVNAAMPGIVLKPLPVAPRQIPFHSGFSYFQLDPRSEYWKELSHSGGVAVHVGGDFPGLSLEFWAIRQ